MSATAVRSEYASLLSTTLPAVIRTEAENERYIATLQDLDRRGSRLSAAEKRMAQLLTLLIEDFEEKHYALKPSDPVSVLRELILANNLKQKNLLDIFGTPSIISEFFTESASSLRNTFGASVDGSTCLQKSFFNSFTLSVSPAAAPRPETPLQSAARNFRVTPANAPDRSTAKLTRRDGAS